jgi:hypothetical protein
MPQIAAGERDGVRNVMVESSVVRPVPNGTQASSKLRASAERVRGA